MNNYQRILNYQLRQRAKTDKSPISDAEMFLFERLASNFANQHRAPLSDEQLFELFEKQFGQNAPGESARNDNTPAPGNEPEGFQPQTRAGKILSRIPGIYSGV
jgi:hypothetical protein